MDLFIHLSGMLIRKVGHTLKDCIEITGDNEYNSGYVSHHLETSLGELS